MLHRHLNHSQFTLAAVDDVIARGRLEDWKELRDSAQESAEIRARILQTGVRQLIREQPLETQVVSVGGVNLVLPTEPELLRIKAVLILQRNATRDYLDFAALAERMGRDDVVSAFVSFDRLYPQPSGESALQQLVVQLANPMPYDLEETDLTEYRRLHPKWQDWNRVKELCAAVAGDLFQRL